MRQVQPIIWIVNKILLVLNHFHFLCSILSALLLLYAQPNEPKIFTN